LIESIFPKHANGAEIQFLRFSPGFFFVERLFLFKTGSFFSGQCLRKNQHAQCTEHKFADKRINKRFYF
jgi:hypothetical protein